MIVGNFSYDFNRDTYTGEITTLTLQRSKVVFRPTDKVGDREPDYRIVQERDGAIVEFGAAWKRSSEGAAISSLSCWTTRRCRPRSTRPCFCPTATTGLRSSGSGRPGKPPPQRLNLRMRGPGGLPLHAVRALPETAYVHGRSAVRPASLNGAYKSAHRTVSIRWVSVGVDALARREGVQSSSRLMTMRWRDERKGTARCNHRGIGDQCAAIRR